MSSPNEVERPRLVASWRPHGRRAARDLLVIAGSLLAATLLVALLEWRAGLPSASPIYLVVVVIATILAGTASGLAVAVISVVLYDLLFTAPALTLEVTDPSEWLEVVLLSFLAITVGQLVAVQRRRATEALEREQEAEDLYAISRAIATEPTVEDALASIVTVLGERTGLDRVWIGLGANPEHERTVADSGHGAVPEGATLAMLRRSSDASGGAWLIVHAPGARRGQPSADGRRHRVVIEASGSAIGSIWGIRPVRSPMPDATATRLLAATADQIGQAVNAERLAARASEARVARAGDELKSALVESVSHDLRIPLAAIRAAAGPLMEPGGWSDPEDVHRAARHIDREAARLDRLVANLLDLGRVQAGMLRAQVEAAELDEVVQRSLTRLEAASPEGATGPAFQVHVPETWVDADPMLLQQALQNVLENAVRHTPAGTAVRVSTGPSQDAAMVRLTIEDAGPGVSDEALPRLFDRFYRGSATGSRQRPGSGLGLAVARGFVEAMGGRIGARRSSLGGLAIDIDLPRMATPEFALETGGS